MVAWQRKRSAEYPRLVAIETTNRCNAHCSFCPNHALARDKGAMDDDLFAKIVEDCRQFPLVAIEPFLQGEPFADPKIIDRLAHIRRRLPRAKLRLYTNGNALTPARADELLGLGIDHLYVSLNTLDSRKYADTMGLELERTLRNLDHLTAPARGQRVARAITFRMTRLEDTTLTEQDDFIRYCRDRGVASFIVGLFNYKGDVSSGLPVPGYACEHVHRLDILASGRVTLCCMDQDGQYGWGDLRHSSVLELYRHPAAQRYRDWHAQGRRRDIEPCDRCNNWWPGFHGVTPAQALRTTVEYGAYVARHRPSGRRAPPHLPAKRPRQRRDGGSGAARSQTTRHVSNEGGTLLRVAIDARCVAPHRSGIGNYTESLLRHLVPLATGVRFLVLRHPQSRESIFEHERVTELRFAGETKSLHTVLRLGRAQGGFRDCDLYHSPADLVPFGLRCPWVVTMHDLMWVEAPELASAFWPVRMANAAWYRHTFGYAIRGARRVIAISRATADAIGRLYPEQASRTRVVRHGLDHLRYAPQRAGPRAMLDRFVPPGMVYSLIVGQGSPYKNHAGMIRAFVEATADQPDHKLVVVRRFTRFDGAMRRLLGRSEVRAKVIQIGHVADDELLALYRHARMLLFVSHYEGFGLPALEAMSVGTAVLASTAPAVREITGDGALHAQASDHADMVSKIRRLDGDDALRERLVAAGIARAREFSWSRCAEQTLAVYREALGSGAGA